MKTKTFLFTVIVTFFTISVFTSCDEDGDTVKPTITVIAPAEGAALTVGEPIYFEAVFSDNENLGSYKIDIHDASGHTHGDDDDHDHDHSDGDNSNKFSFIHVGNLSGTTQTVKESLELDGALAEAYHLVVYCYDAAGNEIYVARNFSLVLPE